MFSNESILEFFEMFQSDTYAPTVSGMRLTCYQYALATVPKHINLVFTNMASKCKSTTNYTMEVIAFIFIWYWFRKVAPHSKIYIAIYRRQHRQWILERMEDSSGSETSDPLLHRVLSASLDAEKSWFALNSVKCGGKPSRFCSSGFAQVFPDEYRQIALDDLVGCDGFPAPASWFSASSRRAENVYVASAFGLVVGILRQKTLDAPFFQTEDFQLIRAWINGFNFVSLELHPCKFPASSSYHSEPAKTK